MSKFIAGFFTGAVFLTIASFVIVLIAGPQESHDSLDRLFND